MRSMSRSFVPGVTVLIALLLPAGCPLSLFPTDSDSPNATAVKTLTLVHGGVDFSAGVVGTLEAGPENSDGETIGWPPWPNNWVPSDTEVWFRPAANTNEANFTKDMGAVSLSSVTAVPATWDGGPGLDLPALQVGRVYVVKCLDGYAKFLVKAIRAEQDWAVDVEYVFTSGTTFAN